MSQQREPRISDPKLRALRQQLGKAGWSHRIAQAREREAVVQKILRVADKGIPQAEAIEKLSLSITRSTAQRWVSLYREGGLAALVDRRGGVATKANTEHRAEQIRNNGNAARKNGQSARTDKKSTAGSTRGGRRALSFVKWAGSKARVMPQLMSVMPASPDRYGTYYEPMVGSGTVFFTLQPRRAVLGDTNPELMNCFEVIRDNVEELIEALKKHKNTYEHFIKMRGKLASELPPVERAARTIFLNKTCFNGLYRLNRSGYFNVPYGNMPQANFCDEAALVRISRDLKKVRLTCNDFAKTVRRAKAGDLVYFDPPYFSPITNKTFGAYQAERFGEKEHEKLADVFRDLDARGCFVVLSNSNTTFVRKLYRGYKCRVLTTRRLVNSVVSERGGWKELLIWNFGDNP